MNTFCKEKKNEKKKVVSRWLVRGQKLGRSRRLRRYIDPVHNDQRFINGVVVHIGGGVGSVANLGLWAADLSTVNLNSMGSGLLGYRFTVQ